MQNEDVIIHVEGGVVQAVYVKARALSVRLIDLDDVSDEPGISRSTAKGRAKLTTRGARRILNRAARQMVEVL